MCHLGRFSQIQSHMAVLTVKGLRHCFLYNALVSTIAVSQVFCLCHNCHLPWRVAPKCSSTRFDNPSLPCPTISFFFVELNYAAIRSLKSLNTNQWPINDRQNLAILCTKRLMVVHQTLFCHHKEKQKKVVWPCETTFHLTPGKPIPQFWYHNPTQAEVRTRLAAFACCMLCYSSLA